MRSLLIVALLFLGGNAWSQSTDLRADRQAELAQFRQRLIAVAYQHTTYPSAARPQGLEGTGIVAVAYDAEGRQTAALKRSTGHEILDRQALAVARRAASTLAVPETLRGVEFSVDLGFAFSHAN